MKSKSLQKTFGFFFHSDASRNESQGCLSARATCSRRSVTQGFIATKKIKSG